MFFLANHLELDKKQVIRGVGGGRKEGFKGNWSFPGRSKKDALYRLGWMKSMCSYFGSRWLGAAVWVVSNSSKDC